MNTVNFLDLKRQYKLIEAEINSAIQKVLSNADFIKGKSVSEFEENFSQYLSAKHVIGVGNGTDALELAIAALDLPSDAEVIVPANSFIASAEAVSNNGLKVIFCDCNDKNYTLDIEDLKSKITPKTKVIMAVHLYGHPCDMDALQEIVEDKEIYILEDCAQAHGSVYKSRFSVSSNESESRAGQKVGTLGDIAAFSFYPGKNLGAYGDGGGVVTNDEALAKRVRMLADHGRSDKYNHQFVGRNSRLDTLQAAILNVKLPYLSDWLNIRKQIAQIYRSKINSQYVTLPQESTNVWQAYHLFVIRLFQNQQEHRDALKDFLKQKDIATGIHYPIALPDLTAYQSFNQNSNQSCVNASTFAKQIVSIPIGEHMNEADAVYVSESINDFFNKMINE